MQKISFTTLSTPGLDVHAVAVLARRFGYDGAVPRSCRRTEPSALHACFFTGPLRCHERRFRICFSQIEGKARKLFISDMRRENEGYATVFPGLGVVPLGESYEAVGGKNYDGWISLKHEKFWDPGLEGPETSLPYFIEKAPGWFPGWKK